MTPRRRKARHSLNPLGWVPPETVALIVKAVGAGLVVAFPALAVRQEGLGRQQTANEATNVALGAAAALQESLSVFRAQFGQFRVEMRESRLREARTAARLPEALVGPVVPLSRRHWWQRG